MLFALALAHAHVPHDVVRAFAVPSDLSDSAPWWVSGSGTSIIVARSDDAAATWTRDAELETNYVFDFAYTDDGTLYALHPSFYYYSLDQGDTWTRVNWGAGANDTAGGDRFWLVNSSGIYATTDPGTSATLVQSGSFSRIWASGTSAAAIDSTGVPYVWDGTSFTARSKPLSRVVTTLTPDGQYAGTSNGTVHRWDSTRSRWTNCGALPVTTQRTLLALALDGYDGTSLIAGAAYDGPYLSTDDCASWVDRTNGEPPYFGRPGGATSAEPTFRDIYAYNGTFVTVGWAGVWKSEDQGVTWTQGNWFTSSYPTATFLPEGLDEGVDSAEPAIDEGFDAEGCATGGGVPGAWVWIFAPALAVIRRRPS